MNRPPKHPFRGSRITLAVLAVSTAVFAGLTLLQPAGTPRPAVDSPTAQAPARAAAQSTGAAQSAAAPPATIPGAADMLGTLRALISGAAPLVISVLGDSTGDDPGEWVDLWAQELARRGTVTLHLWDAGTAEWDANPKVYPGPERTITIWNGSRSGANPSYPLQHLDRIQPSKPSLTVLNFGHNPAPQPAGRGAEELLAGVDARWDAPIPAAVVLQNPSLNLREARTEASVAALRDWAPRAGYAAIDVNAAFRAGGDLGALLADDVHPNPAGQRLWAATVSAALG